MEFPIIFKIISEFPINKESAFTSFTSYYMFRAKSATNHDDKIISHVFGRRRLKQTRGCGWLCSMVQCVIVSVRLTSILFFASYSISFQNVLFEIDETWPLPGSDIDSPRLLVFFSLFTFSGDSELILEDEIMNWSEQKRIARMLNKTIELNTKLWL